MDVATAGLIGAALTVIGNLANNLTQRSHQKKVAMDNLQMARANLKKDLQLHYGI